MTFDLGKAMAKKGEFESARLADFEFRQRARTFRLMAEKIGREADPARVVAMITQMADDTILVELAASFPETRTSWIGWTKSAALRRGRS